MKINKKIVLLAIAVLAAAAFLFSQSSVFSVIAQGSTLKDLLKLNTSATQTTGKALQDFGNSQAIDQTQAGKNAAVVAQAKQLIGKAEKEYLTAGWLHLYSTTETLSTEQKTFPDGSPIPTKWTNDLWVLLDKNGDAIKAVTIQDTGDPKLLQISVYENQIWTNITLGTTTTPEAYHPTLDAGLLDTAGNYSTTVKFSSGASALDGQNTIVFTTREDLKTPVNTGKDQAQDAQMYGSLTKYYFANESGLPVQTENYKIDSAGSPEILQRIIMKVIEKVSMPPANILAYFTK